jgi:hypothetical protein
MTSPVRDPLVERALRRLPVPEHAPGFWDELEARLGTNPVPSPIAGDSSVAAPDPYLEKAWDHRPARTLMGAVAALAAAVVLVAAVVVAGRASHPEGRTQRPAAPGSTAPTTATTALDPAAQGAVDAVRTFLDALGHGDRKTAAGLLGPRSEQYAIATAGSADAMLQVAEEGFGAWAASPDRTYRAIAIRPGDVVVVVQGTRTSEGQVEHRADAIPARKAESAGVWFVEPWAFDPATGGRMELQTPDPAGNPPRLGVGQSVEVSVAAPGDAWFALDGPAERVTAVSSPAGRVARWRPVGVAPGRHLLVVAFVNDTTFTALAREIDVD